MRETLDMAQCKDAHAGSSEGVMNPEAQPSGLFLAQKEGCSTGTALLFPLSCLVCVAQKQHCTGFVKGQPFKATPASLYDTAFLVLDVLRGF